MANDRDMRTKLLESIERSALQLPHDELAGALRGLASCQSDAALWKIAKVMVELSCVKVCAAAPAATIPLHAAKKV